VEIFFFGAFGETEEGREWSGVRREKNRQLLVL
jgi:hypothetical protein